MQIDDDAHHVLCTMHAEFEHKCWDRAPASIRPTPALPFSRRLSWVLATGFKQGYSTYREVPVDFCPWCGEELGQVDCICDELAKERMEVECPTCGEPFEWEEYTPMLCPRGHSTEPQISKLGL